ECRARGAAAHRAADHARRSDDSRLGVGGTRRNERMIIDCHGHYTTAPKPLEDWRNRQIAALNDGSVAPKTAELRIGDDELRESIERNQLAKMNERGSDLTIFSPRASFMAHHIGGFETS